MLWLGVGAFCAGLDLAGGDALPCERCHGKQGESWIAAPACQSCHTGSALERVEIRFNDILEPGGKVRERTGSAFGVPAGRHFTNATGHGGLKCSECHGGYHDDPHMRVIEQCSKCHSPVPKTIEGGPHGLHPVGAEWVTAHGPVVDENGAAACRRCHGTDGRGTVLSRLRTEQTFRTIAGVKHFPAGVSIGCYSCHSPSGGGGK